MPLWLRRSLGVVGALIYEAVSGFLLTGVGFIWAVPALRLLNDKDGSTA